MRSLEELTKLLNPDGIKTVWIYVPVEHTYTYPTGTTEKSIFLHEVYINAHGGFAGAIENPLPPTGDNIEDLKKCLVAMTKGCDNALITKEELNLIRS